MQIQSPNINNTVFLYLIELTNLYCTELGYNGIKGCFTITFIDKEEATIKPNFEGTGDYMTFVEANKGLTVELYVLDEGITVLNTETRALALIDTQTILTMDTDTGISKIAQVLDIDSALCVSLIGALYEEELNILTKCINHIKGVTFSLKQSYIIDGEEYINVLEYQYGVADEDKLHISVEYDDEEEIYLLYANTSKVSIYYEATEANIVIRGTKFINKINSLIRV